MPLVNAYDAKAGHPVRAPGGASSENHVHGRNEVPSGLRIGTAAQVVELAILSENPPDQIAITRVDPAEIARLQLLDLIRGQQALDLIHTSFSAKLIEGHRISAASGQKCSLERKALETGHSCAISLRTLYVRLPRHAGRCIPTYDWGQGRLSGLAPCPSSKYSTLTPGQLHIQPRMRQAASFAMQRG